MKFPAGAKLGNISLNPTNVYQLILLQRNFQTGVGFSKIKPAPVWKYILPPSPRFLKPCTGRKYILPDRCGFLKPWTGWKYILPDRCGFYQNFNLGLGGSLNFQTGAGFSEKNNPHVSGSIYFRPVQGLKTRTSMEVYTSTQSKVIKPWTKWKYILPNWSRLSIEKIFPPEQNYPLQRKTKITRFLQVVYRDQILIEL